MRRTVASLAVLFVLTAGVRPAQAVSTPVINVSTFGIELCPQSLCNAAIFVGFFQGQVGGNQNAVGTFTTALTHEDLPDAFQTAAITGGVFELRVGLHRMRGIVMPGGTLFNNNNNTYTVDIVLVFTSGATGTANYHGLLNHNTFPPTILGIIYQ